MELLDDELQIVLARRDLALVALMSDEAAPAGPCCEGFDSVEHRLEIAGRCRNLIQYEQ